MPCTAIPGVIRDSPNTTIDVNVRAEGGYSLYRNLSGVSRWRYDIYHRDNTTDQTSDSPDGTIRVTDSDTLMGQVYVDYFSDSSWAMNLFLKSWSTNVSVFDWPVMDKKFRIRDKEEAKRLLESVYVEDCKKKLDEVLAVLNLTKYTQYDNPLRAGDLVAIFDDITKQTRGGIYFDDDGGARLYKELQEAKTSSVSPIASGGGIAASVVRGKSYGTGSDAFLWIRGRSYASKPGSVYALSETFARRKATGNLIHELFHGAGKNIYYEHEEMDSAAKSGDPTVTGFDAFLGKYCETE